MPAHPQRRPPRHGGPTYAEIMASGPDWDALAAEAEGRPHDDAPDSVAEHTEAETARQSRAKAAHTVLESASWLVGRTDTDTPLSWVNRFSVAERGLAMAWHLRKSLFPGIRSVEELCALPAVRLRPNACAPLSLTLGGAFFHGCDERAVATTDATDATRSRMRRAPAPAEIGEPFDPPPLGSLLEPKRGR